MIDFYHDKGSWFGTRRKIMSPRSLYLLAVVASIACTPASTTSASSTPGPVTGAAHRDMNLITEDEIAASSGSNAYDVVSRLRPNFLKTRGRNTIYASPNDYASVYVDDQSFGDINSLRNIVANQVHEIRYYSASDAVTRFGTQTGQGVIDVKTKK
jgi:hypothetical protein